MSNDKEVILSVRNLKQHFKSGVGNRTLVVKAVDDVSFDIHKGEVFGLVGESGCGKTTTGRTIINIYDPTDGEVYFKNRRTAFGLNKDKERISKFKEEKKKVLAENLPILKKLKSELNAELKKYNAEKKAILAENSAEIEKLNANMKSELDDLNEQKTQNTQEFKTELVKLKTQLKDSLNSEEKKAIKIQIQSLESKHQDDTSLLSDKKIIVKENNKLLKEDILVNNGLNKNKIDELEDEIQKYNLIISDYDKKNDKKLMQKMQMIFQDPIASLNPRMTVKEIVSEGLVVNGEKNKALITKKVNKALETVGLLPEHASRYPHEFSGGQRQRIGIARALIVEPEFIIADEPISALDVSIQAQVINLMNDLKENLGITILFIAHDLSVVKYFSDRIGVMYFGKLVELATADELFKNPLHPYTKSLLSAVPHPDPNYEKNRKRVTYNPKMHNYDEHPAKMHEVKEGHFIYANEEELEKYKAELT